MKKKMFMQYTTVAAKKTMSDISELLQSVRAALVTTHYGMPKLA